MIHRNDIGRPIAIMRADQVRVGDRIVHADPYRFHNPHHIDRVIEVEHVGDDVTIVHERTGPVGKGEFTTSIGNPVIVVR